MAMRVNVTVGERGEQGIPDSMSIVLAMDVLFREKLRMEDSLFLRLLLLFRGCCSTTAGSPSLIIMMGGDGVAIVSVSCVLVVRTLDWCVTGLLNSMGISRASSRIRNVMKRTEQAARMMPFIVVWCDQAGVFR